MPLGEAEAGDDDGTLKVRGMSTSQISDAGSAVFFAEMTEDQKQILKREVHPDDMEMIDGGMDPDVSKALRHRREKNFANDITGPVHNGRLSCWTIFAYAPPSLTTVPLTLLISVYVIQFYENVGASLGLLAFFQALARAFDVVTDPTMSYISDSCRSKRGRRRPFLFTGAPFYCICLMCLLFPQPSLDTYGSSIWFGFFYIFFFLFATYCNIPYDALGPELTDNQADRSKLFFACTMFDGFGALCAACLPVGLTYFVNGFRADNVNRYQSCDNPTSFGMIDALSASGPWYFASSGRSTPPSSVRDFSASVNVTAQYIADNFANTRESCPTDDKQYMRALANITGFNSTTRDLYMWCECRNKADVTFDLDSLRYAYMYTGIFFGLWALISLWTLVKCVKERGQLEGAKELPPPDPLVPSILNTLRNKPFTILLPSWVLDSLANAIIGSLLTFFVRYIVQPEYSNPDWGCRPIGGADDWRCKSPTVLGASVVALLLGALLFTPLWLLAAKCFGKRNTWLLWSFLNGVTFLCYVPVGKGDVYLCIVMSVFNGAPLGAKFLADSIMADVIDYDEFITGTRSEATYTMFKGFLPKIAAIPASALPIVLLSTFGHVKPIDGVLQPQPQSIRNFIVIVIIWIPSMLAFGAFILKLRFPLTTSRHNELITEGVSLHLLGKPAEDPCTGRMYKEVHFTVDEQPIVDMLGAFPGVAPVKGLLGPDSMGGIKAGKDFIKTKATKQLGLAFLWLLTFLLIVMFTFRFLMSTDAEDENLQVIPVLAIVGFGMGITGMGFTILRFQAAGSIMRSSPKRSTLKKILKQREELSALRDFDATIRKGCRASGLPPRIAAKGVEKDGLEMGPLQTEH